MRQIGVRRVGGGRQPGPYVPAALPRRREVPDDQHDRAGQQRLADPAPGRLRLTADHDEGEHEDGDDGRLRGEVPGGDGDEGPADRHERDEPFGPGQHGREPREDEGAQDGTGRPVQYARDERTEIRLHEEHGGRGKPVPVHVVQCLRDGDGGAVAEGHAEAVLPPSGTGDGAQERLGAQGPQMQALPRGPLGAAPQRMRVRVRVRMCTAFGGPAGARASVVEGLGGVQQGVVEGP
ncbi:hypothetical protein GCM10010372_15940 [Streptomyces tauricus]|nr:hypothetical protein GCM10010372_15940 [Streptomyces tauricus]